LHKRVLKSFRVSSKIEFLTESDEFLLLEKQVDDFCDAGLTNPEFTHLVMELLAL